MADPSNTPPPPPFPHPRPKMSSFRDLPGAVFKTETQLEVTAVLANCGSNIALAAQAIRLWIEAKQRRGKAEMDIIKKVEDMERKYVWDASIHEAFHSARASTGLPRSTILPASRRVREAEERDRRGSEAGSPTSPVAGPSNYRQQQPANLSPVSSRSGHSSNGPAPPSPPVASTSRNSILRRSPSTSRNAVASSSSSPRMQQIPPPPVVRNVLPSLRAASQAPGTPKSFMTATSSVPGLSTSASVSSATNSPSLPPTIVHPYAVGAGEPDHWPSSSRGPPTPRAQPSHFEPHPQSQLPYLHAHPEAANSTETLQTRRWSQGSYTTISDQTISDQVTISDQSISAGSVATFSDASVSTGDGYDDDEPEDDEEDAPMPLSNLMRVPQGGESSRGNPYITMGARGFALTRTGRSGVGRTREGWEEPTPPVNRSLGEISNATVRTAATTATGGSGSGSSSDPDWRAAVDDIIASFPSTPREATFAHAVASPAETVRPSPSPSSPYNRHPHASMAGAARPDSPFHLPPAALDLRTPSALSQPRPSSTTTPVTVTPSGSISHHPHSFGPRPRPPSASSRLTNPPPILPLSPVRLLPVPAAPSPTAHSRSGSSGGSSTGSEWSQPSGGPAPGRPLPEPGPVSVGGSVNGRPGPRHQFSTESEGSEERPPPAYSAVDPRLLNALGV